MKRALGVVFLAVFLSMGVAVQGQARADVTTYTVPVISDFTGAYAELFKAFVPVQKAVVAWWNDTSGKDVGVKLVLKHYDGRYDQTVVASMWPGVLADCKPVIAAFGAGGADVAALQQRLPKDEVPVFYGTAAYGYGWEPNQWIFHVRPTYLHEFLACLKWYAAKHPEKKPIKLGELIGDVTAATDLFKGLDKYVQETLEPQGVCKVVAKEFCAINPVDVSSQVKKLIDAKSDVVIAPITTAMTTAYIRASQTYGANIPTMASPHHTIFPFGRAMKTYEPMEGHFVTAGHVAVTLRDTPAYKWFQDVMIAKYEMQEQLWNPYSMMAFNQTLLVVRAIEHAARKVGGDKLTGRAVYDAMFAGPFTQAELMDTLPTLTFTKDAPFPMGEGVKVMIETVKDGKYTVATRDWVPIPLDLKKW